jgi:thiamine monophosphate synthase
LGPIFSTPSKESYGAPLSPAALDELPPSSDHAADVFAVGGVDEARLPELARRRDRVAGVAAIRYFQHAEDPRAAAARVAAL